MVSISKMSAATAQRVLETRAKQACEDIIDDYDEDGLDAMVTCVLKHKPGWKFEIDENSLGGK